VKEMSKYVKLEKKHNWFVKGLLKARFLEDNESLEQAFMRGYNQGFKDACAGR
jgi:ribosome modulation factor